jgi:hypothetical protein
VKYCMETDSKHECMLFILYYVCAVNYRTHKGTVLNEVILDKINSVLINSSFFLSFLVLPPSTYLFTVRVEGFCYFI